MGYDEILTELKKQTEKLEEIADLQHKHSKYLAWRNYLAWGAAMVKLIALLSAIFGIYKVTQLMNPMNFGEHVQSIMQTL